MNNRFVLFIILSFFVLYGTNWVINKNKKDEHPIVKVQNQSVEKSIKPLIPKADLYQGQTELQLENNKIKVLLSSLNGGLSEIDIKQYGNINPEQPVRFLKHDASSRSVNLFLEIDGRNVDLEKNAWRHWNENTQLKFETSPKAPIKVQKIFTLDESGYSGKMNFHLFNRSSQKLSIDRFGFTLGPIKHESQDRNNQLQAVVLAEKIYRIKTEKKENITTVNNPHEWVGFRDQYFCVLFYQKTGNFAKVDILQKPDQSLEMNISMPSVEMLPFTDKEYEIYFYFGPQDYQLLKKTGFELERVIDFGLFQFISIPLLFLLKFLYQVTRNYGFAIILLTLFIRVILWWPTQKSYSSMKKMQTSMNKMQPRLKTLKEIYKDNPTKLNEETMKLYKEYQINPMGGCLPMLLQMPIFFALYSTLTSAVELKGAEFVWIWKDLSMKDPMFILPVLMGISTFVQQKISSPPAATPEAAAQQKMMLYLMPAMLTFFSFAWPSGLLLYWVVSNVLSIGQQMIINRQT